MLSRASTYKFTAGPSRFRPTVPAPGNQHFDTSLNKVLTWDGYDWFGSDGTIYTLFDFYADSVNGSDANDGLTAATAKATLAAITALVGFQPNKRIGLARGSVWREQLIIGLVTSRVNGTQIGAYGSGAMPLVDGSDPITAGSWSLAASQTLTYQAAVTFTGALPGSGGEFRNVFENGKVLVQASSIANCEATAGSCFLSSYTAGTATLYIHPSDGSNPASNGKTYEYTNRYGVVILYGDTTVTSLAQGAQVRNIRTRRQRCNDGSMVSYGRFSYFRACSIEDGHKHNALLAAGGLAEACTFLNGYNGAGGFENHLVFFDGGSAVLPGIGAINCTFRAIAAVTPATPAALISHSGNGNDAFASMTLTGNKYDGLGAASSCGNVALFVISACLYLNCKTTDVAGDNGTAPAAAMIWNNGQAVITKDLGSAGGINLMPSPGVNGTVVVSASKFWSYTYLPFVVSAAGASFTINDSFVLAGDTSSRYPLGMFRASAAGIKLTSNRTTWQKTFVSDYFFWLLADTVYQGDGNHFVGPGLRWTKDNSTTNIASLAAWRIASGQDNNSDASANATVTLTLAAPGVVNWTAHGLAAGAEVMFSTSGTLPTGLTANTPYYVLASGLAANAFQVSATPGGPAIAFTGTQSGTQTGITCPSGDATAAALYPMAA